MHKRERYLQEMLWDRNGKLYILLLILYIYKTYFLYYVIFSDDKKFNLHSSNGNNYYWRDLRKEPQFFQSTILVEPLLWFEGQYLLIKS